MLSFRSSPSVAESNREGEGEEERLRLQSIPYHSP